MLIYAAGVPRAFDAQDWTVAVFGYVVMRIALTAQWLRAAAGESGPARRSALMYAAGLVVCQAGWIALLAAPAGARRWLFLVLVAAELSVPLIAERRHQTAWHPHHIVERYGLFTLIVLGETVSASTVAVQSALDEQEALGVLLPIAAGGLLIVFSAWWIYFAVPAHERLSGNRQAIPWGYGHYVILGAAAAVGAGMEVAVEQAVGKAHISQLAANLTVTVPTALYLVAVWFLHARHFKRTTAQQLLLPLSALAILACSWSGRTRCCGLALVMGASVAVGVTLTERTRSGA